MKLISDFIKLSCGVHFWGSSRKQSFKSRQNISFCKSAFVSFSLKIVVTLSDNCKRSIVGLEHLSQFIFFKRINFDNMNIKVLSLNLINNQIYLSLRLIAKVRLGAEIHKHNTFCFHHMLSYRLHSSKSSFKNHIVSRNCF